MSSDPHAQFVHDQINFLMCALSGLNLSSLYHVLATAYHMTRDVAGRINRCKESIAKKFRIVTRQQVELCLSFMLPRMFVIAVSCMERASEDGLFESQLSRLLCGIV